MAVPSATVIQYYTGVLRLQPTTQQVTYLSNALDEATLLNILETEALTQVNPIIRLYQGAFNRVPDSAGLTNIVGKYVNGPVGTTAVWSLTQISQNFCASPEFIATYGSSAPVATTTGTTAYISALYNNILGRVPATSEVQFWQNWTAQQLSAGTSAATVTAQLLTMFTESPEFIQSSAPYIQNFQAASAEGTETYTGTLWAQGVAETFTLTTSIDAPGFGAFAAGSPTGNSETMAILGTDQTLNAFDQIQATGSNNTMTLVDASGGTSLAAAQVSGIQTLNARSIAGIGNNTNSAGVASFDVSGWTGLTAVNVTQSAGADYLKAAATTAVNVSQTSASGSVTVDGGSTQTVTTAGGAVTLTNAAGAVNLTNSAQGANNVVVEDGTTVNLNLTQATTGAYTVRVGNTTAATQPSGAVTIVSNQGPAAAGAFTGGAITVNGGSTVDVTINATQPDNGTSATTYTTTQSTVTANGGAGTSSVVINQTKAVTPTQGFTAVTGANAVKTVTFADVTVSGQPIEVVVDTLKLTVTTSATAAQIAAAFANLANGAISGNVSTNIGVFSGTLSGWSSGAASGSAVTFSSTAQTTGESLTATSGGSALGQTTVTAGVSAVTGVTALGGIAAGALYVLDANYAAGSGTSAGTITSVTANNYDTSAEAKLNSGAVSAGLVISSNNLSTVNATNGGGITINNASSLTTKPATTLDLNISGVSGEFDDSDVYTTINVTTGATASTLAKIKDTALTTLNVAGTSALTVTSSADATALKTINVSGSAGLTGSFVQSTLTAINASGTSGNNTITMNGSLATYTGGTGVDAVTTATSVNTVSKAIDLGAGNDTLVLANGVQTVSAGIGGGLGNDTISMLAADAAANAASSQFISNMSGFEAVRLRGASTNTVDLGLLALAAGSSSINSNVFVSPGGDLTLNNFANNGSLTIDGNQTGTIALTNATAWTGTGTANITLLDATTGATGNAVTGGIVTVAGASTVNVVTSQVATAINADTLTIEDVSSSTDFLTTINVTGNSNLTLTGDVNNAVLTTVNATGMTGALTYTALGTLAQTVTGGNGNDVLSAHVTASTLADTLVGGAGDDTLTTNAGLTTLTGGAGNDTFVVNVANTSATIYSTITDFGVGDHLQMKAAAGAAFNSTKIALAPTATFLEYLNAAAAGSTVGVISWFQFEGNTYVMQDNGGGSTYASTDIVVGLTGVVDLSNAALSINTVASVANTPTLTLFA